jgi:outer membrane protein OmpA-like peptidoglycan-associated protein
MLSKATKFASGLALLALSAAVPGLAQEPGKLKEIFDKAQGERDKRAVDDLIKRLEGGKAPEQRPASPAPPVAAPQPPAAPPAQPPPIAATPPASPPVAAPPAAPPSPPVAAPQPTPSPPVAERPPVPAPQTPVAAPQTPPVAPAPPQAPIAERPPATTAPPPVPVEKAPEMARRQELPSVDLEIYFDYASANITPQAVAMLRTLGAALSDPRLRSSRFLIAGHTDGHGTVAYNLTLSQARAEAVRGYLIENFKLDPANLEARGFGKSQFKNTRNPFANENRRVQVINLSGGGQAARRAR